MAKRKYTTRKREPKKTFRGVMPIKQRIWNLMRRMKSFKPADIQALMGVNYHTLRAFLYPLEIAGFIRKKKYDPTKKRQKFMDTTFVFTADEKILDAPAVSTKEVYCFYKQESCDIAARYLLVGALEYMSQGEVAQKTGISKTAINQLLHNKYPSPAPMYDVIRKTLG